MVKKTKLEQVRKLVEKAIAKADYSYIRKAEEIAIKAEIEMCFDDEFVSVGDDIYYFNGIFD